MSSSNKVAPEFMSGAKSGRAGGDLELGSTLLRATMDYERGMSQSSPVPPPSSQVAQIKPKPKKKKKQKKQNEPEGFSITGRTGKAVVQLSVFLLTNFIIAFFLFVWPKLTPYKYYVSVKGGGEQYSFTPGRIQLDVEDIPDGPLPELSFLAHYNSPVKFVNDTDEDPGWDLQDILGLPRATNKADQCCENQVLLGQQRMMQDFRFCAQDCLDGSGLPQDYYDENTGLPKRDYTKQPYGVLGLDWYVDRSRMLKLYDFDFYQMFIANNGAGSNVRQYYGNHGLEAFRGKGGALLQTYPTDDGFICNLGQRRRPVAEIVVQAHGCHVQIASTNGSSYYAFTRLEYKDQLTASIEEVVNKDLRTGCRTRSVVVKVFNPFCARPLPGFYRPPAAGEDTGRAPAAVRGAHRSAVKQQPQGGPHPGAAAAVAAQRGGCRTYRSRDHGRVQHARQAVSQPARAELAAAAAAAARCSGCA